MQVFITGATGFIGRSLVEELLSRHWQVRALARGRARARRLPPEAFIIRGSLSDESALLEGASGADVVYHLAAATAGGWEQHAEATVEGTRRMLRISHEAGVQRFILTSSIVVYNKSGLRADAVVDESAPLLAPTPSAGAYARGKLEAETLARQYAQDAGAGMEVVIVRPGLVYGKDRLTFPHLGELVGQARIAYGRSSLLLPLVEVHSCVDALVRLATAPGASGRTYNLVDADESTRSDYLAALEVATGHRQRVFYLPSGPVATAGAAIAAILRLTGKGGSDFSAAKIRERAVEKRYDTGALQRDTGWRPLRKLEQGMARAGLAAARGAPCNVERVGIIGAGMIARVHLAALSRIPGVRIAGIFDVDRTAAEALASEADGAAAFDDVDRFYGEAKPQLVHVLTPPHTHAAVAMEALQRKAHVLLEKPATVTVEECDELIAAADAGSLTVGVDETVAWDPLVRRARAALLNGILGELIDVDVFMSYDLRRGGRLQQLQSGSGGWEQRLVGSYLEDLLPHPLSVVRALCGELELVHSRTRTTGRVPGDTPDELRLALSNDRLSAQVAVSLSARPDDFLVTIHGTRASIRIDLQNMLYDCLTPLPGPRALVRGLRVLRSAARAVGQTGRNGLLIASRRTLPPASPVHLIRQHYAALSRGEPLPAPLSGARADIAITRSVWPAVERASLELPGQSKPEAATAAAFAPVGLQCSHRR